MTSPLQSGSTRRRQSPRLLWAIGAASLALHLLMAWAFVHFSPAPPASQGAPEKLMRVTLRPLEGTPVLRAPIKPAAPKKGKRPPKSGVRPVVARPTPRPKPTPKPKPRVRPVVKRIVTLRPTPFPVFNPTLPPAPLPTRVPVVRPTPIVTKANPVRTNPLLSQIPRKRRQTDPVEQPTPSETETEPQATSVPVATFAPRPTLAPAATPIPQPTAILPNNGVGNNGDNGVGNNGNNGVGDNGNNGVGNNGNNGVGDNGSNGVGNNGNNGMGKNGNNGVGNNGSNGLGDNGNNGLGDNGNGGLGDNGNGGNSGGGGGGGGGRNGGGAGPYGTGGHKDGEPPRHIVYVLDLSTSMKPRVDRAAEELKSALRGLQHGESFGMIGFSHAARRFKKKLVPADAQVLGEANQWLDKMPLDYGTDLEKAMNQAFSMKGVNVVVLITDGVPTMGQTDFAKLAARVRQLNGNRARIDTIGLKGDNSKDENGNPQNKDFEATRLLEQIARDSGGQFKVVPD